MSTHNVGAHRSSPPNAAERYPIGASVVEADLIKDPYPIYAALHARERVTWIEALQMWWVVGYDHAVEILTNEATFTTASENSLIFDTFGTQMLSVEGGSHGRYKNAVRATFQPRALRESLESSILASTDMLIDGFPEGGVDLRPEFAARLPILTMLQLFGLPSDTEASLRTWYNAFEHALANFSGDSTVRADAKQSVGAFHALLQQGIEKARQAPDASLLSAMVHQPDNRALSDEEIRNNISIIMFGGISTVEALILNTVWALARHPELEARVCADLSLLPQTIEEVLRWQSPVQSATRHVDQDVEFHGHRFRAGDTVNCILGAANRDPLFLADADRFDIDRTPAPRHLTFATGRHLCLGMHLARLQARIALEQLYRRLPGLTPAAGRRDEPQGFEFRQPRTLPVTWADWPLPAAQPAALNSEFQDV